MKKLLPLIVLLALLLACRTTSAPVQSPTQAQPQQQNPTRTPTAIVAAPEPVVPADGLTVTDPMISDPNAGQAKFRLMELGYDICTVTTDFYNYQVQAAVEQFQYNAGLSVTGVLDTTTLNRLMAANAPVQETVSAIQLNTGNTLFLSTGDMLVETANAFWIIESGYFTQFSVQGDFLGFYQVEPLPGEEIYQPVAMAFDGSYLWIAQQGTDDAIVQAYDPTAANPVDGFLRPVSTQSIHFPSTQLYRTAAFDGQNVWFLADDMRQDESLFLQPVDTYSGTAGTPIRIGQSSGFGYGYGIAPEPATGTLWVTYADDIFGEQAIVAVDPLSGTVGPALGPCGAGVTYSQSRLWFINQQGLWSVDPLTGDRTLYDYATDNIRAVAAGSDALLLLDYSGTLTEVKAP